MTRRRCFAVGVGMLLLVSCSGVNDVLSRAGRLGLTRDLVNTGGFTLATYHKGLQRAPAQVVVYIEGDGNAWRGRHRLSPDPTPKAPLALQLALADPSPSVIYIARPCQFVMHVDSRNCDAKYWSSHRYGEAVILAIGRAIDHLLARLAVKPRLGMVGYSGGAAVAAIIAATRDDVAWLVTAAGNLDHVYWANIHNVTPLHGSLNAADYAPRLTEVPQMHFAGGRDRNVPAEVVERFRSKAEEWDNFRLQLIPDYDHRCCWSRDWPALLCVTGFWPDRVC